MEALATTSGIVGVITFATRALSAIDGLKEVCGEFSEDGKNQLFHDLDVTSNILLHAKELAEQVQLQGIDLSLKYRAGALQIQIDDCARDLEAWLRAARHLTGPIKSNHRVHKQEVFNRILTAFTKSSRTTALRKLQKHRQNINTTLSIFGRQIDLAMTRRLQKLEKASEDQSGDTKDLSRRLSDLASSISSSTNSIHVQNSETSRKLDSITEILHQLALKPDPPKAQGDTRNDSEDVNQAPNFNIVPNPDIEFELPYRVFASMTNTLRHLYTPQVSEFLTTMYAWTTIEYYEVCTRLKPMPDVQTGKFDKTFTPHELERLHRHVTRQLFAIRKTFFREGLGETFDNIVESMKMGHLWSKANLDQIFGTHSLRRQLASYQPLNTIEEREERLTRMNEWLLGVLKAQEYHRLLYRSIFADTFRTAPVADFKAWYQGLLQAISHLECVDSLEDGTPRITMKYWFLDAAATLQGEAAASSAMGLSDSDATFRPLEVESTGDLRDLEDLEDWGDSGDFDPEASLLRTAFPRGCLFTLTPSSLDTSDPGKGLTDLPDGVSKEDIHQATSDLEAYQRVPD